MILNFSHRSLVDYFPTASVSAKVGRYGRTNTNPRIGIFTVLMVVPITNTNPGIGNLGIVTNSRLGFGNYF